MSYHFSDNVHTRSFTPREPNVELLDVATERNIIVCLCTTSGKNFVAHKLIQHMYNSIHLKPGTIALYVTDSSSVVRKQAGSIRRLTNLSVAEFDSVNVIKKSEWKESLKDQVLIMTTQVALFLFEEEHLNMSDINLLILHGCHCVVRHGSVPMKELMKCYFESEVKPHMLGLANSIFVSGISPSQMEFGIQKMEDILDSRAETASTIVSALRYSTQPHEVVIECAQRDKFVLDDPIEKEVNDAIHFLRDHRFNPNEVYEGYVDELNIPDPTLQPVEILTEFLQIYHTLGPWSADKGALVLLIHIEKLKVATPYERHFLLLCMVFTVMLKIRAMLSDFFDHVDPRERVYKYTSPKILRLIEVLRKFQPPKSQSDCEDLSDAEEETAAEGTSNSDEKEANDGEEPTPKKDGDVAAEDTTPVAVEAAKTDNEPCNEEEEANPQDSEAKDDSREADPSTNPNSEVTEPTSVETTSDVKTELAIVKIDDTMKSSEAIQKKNGIVPMRGNEPPGEYRRRRGRLNNRNAKMKKEFMPGKNPNTVDSYLQCHEYLLLPKFKVDKHARYDRHHQAFANQARPVAPQDDSLSKQMKNLHGEVDLQQLCGIIFVEKKFTAKVLFQVLSDLKQCDEDFSFLNVQFTIGKLLDGSKDPKGAENEHRKQEFVLKNFRTRECNLLIGTSFLEEGIDLPKCNLVVRFNVPRDYRSYVHTKERARATDSLFCHLVDCDEKEFFVHRLAEYFETERILLRKCWNLEPTKEEEIEADQYTPLIEPFCPLMKRSAPHVDLSSAIALVNRYCAKLPSDTFTRLAPLWNVRQEEFDGRTMYSCSIRLPINSPVKQEIRGYTMPTVVLARRFAAFQCCQILHLEGELDDSLQPITKESFWLREESQLMPVLDDPEDAIPLDATEPRPGTTKRRQYYYKKIADSLTSCRPSATNGAYLYDISMVLTCPLPEEQNTRGRKIHAPEDSLQGFGILTCKTIPQIGAFPIFTRSGEVQVKLQLAQTDVYLTEEQLDKIVAFIHYTFTSVLKLQRYLMMFDPNASENSYFIVPTKRDDKFSTARVDWDFLELIYMQRNNMPKLIPDETRQHFVFDKKKFEDAVVTPWYRNQDEPQYFYVAEICFHLSPKSAFPGTEYDTFEEYYLKKYNIQIQNTGQALLDVDHTSARLNFLTPRYVNRKGVALPTTSEEKKKAKRENLEQKQILVPELCNIHPFPGTLWRKAVCLPCILHRINALLLADQVRRIVAREIGVGLSALDPDFYWKPLDFGWSLSDVLAQSRALQQKREEKAKETVEKPPPVVVKKEAVIEEVTTEVEEDAGRGTPWMEIGTWSNDMAAGHTRCQSPSDESDLGDMSLPHNVTMIEGSKLSEETDWRKSDPSQEMIRYGSPTEWNGSRMIRDDMSDAFSEDSYMDDLSDDSDESDGDCGGGGLRIEFKDDNVAEAIENKTEAPPAGEVIEDDTYEDEAWMLDESPDEAYDQHLKTFGETIERTKESILCDGTHYDKDKEFDFVRACKSHVSNKESSDEAESTEPFGTADNTFPKVIDRLPESLTDLPLTSLIIRSLDVERSRGGMRIVRKVSPPSQDPPVVVPPDPEMFSFDDQPNLSNHPGPSPSLILQALTMSNANDGINLERLETIGDSFLKYAITAYLYCTYENVHEGKLSHLRSKQVSNYSLYRLGHKKVLGESMVATKFEPHDNWLPPCYYIPRELERALIKTGLPASHWNRADLPSLRNLTDEEICQLVKERGDRLGFTNKGGEGFLQNISLSLNLENMPCFIPYNLMTQHSIPDKSIADCVEALIGAYLVACGPRGALLFMSWLGIRVLPRKEEYFKTEAEIPETREIGTTIPVKVTRDDEEVWYQASFGVLKAPTPPLLRNVPDPEGDLQRLLRGFDVFEDEIQYRFRDKSYLLQALTHASFSSNRLTDCYQRLEFLGDAVLDYLITRHLYEDPRHHSPGALTDLRSALVNNTIFASLAVRHNFHKYFRHLCPGLTEVIDHFVRIQEENNHSINEEFYLIEEEECEEAEDVEVPKALGDIFESIAGAIFLDSGMSLDAVWRVYYRMMKKEIELFSTNVPKSPIRELFEMEPETAQFGKPEKLADGKRVRVTVEVFGKGLFSGIGRNYRIAKCTAAKCALKKLKNKGLLQRRK